MAGKWITYIQEFVGPQPRAQKTNVTPLPPKSLGSHASRLIQLIRAGHYDVALPRDQWVRLVTWVDANGPYYGSYFGRRHLKYQALPDFRPLPTLDSPGEFLPPSNVQGFGQWLGGEDCAGSGDAAGVHTAQRLGSHPLPFRSRW